MNLKYIREFIELASTENYQEAAERLFVSQSALSKHIMALEEELGVTLFNRTTRRVTLSSDGHLFLTYARQIIRNYETYLEKRDALFQRKTTQICIGSIPNMMQYHITDVLSRFQQLHSDVSFSITEADSCELINLLHSEKCDFAFVRMGTQSDDALEMKFYATDTLVAVLPELHPLAQLSSIALAQLQQEHFLMLPESSSVYQSCISACSDAGFFPHIVYTTSRGENIMDMVVQNRGISLLTKRPATYLSTLGVSLVDIEPKINMDVCISWKKERNLSQIQAEFLSFLFR